MHADRTAPISLKESRCYNFDTFSVKFDPPSNPRRFFDGSICTLPANGPSGTRASTTPTSSNARVFAFAVFSSRVVSYLLT
jgi:hypothetical protein